MIKLMIFDHQILDVIAMEKALENSYFEVVKLTGPYGVLSKIDFEKPEILLFNPDIPNFDVDSFLQTIRYDERLQSLVIICVAHGLEEDVEGFARQENLHGYYLKNIGFGQLLAYLEQFLEIS